jgi:hypothetical protein
MTTLVLSNTRSDSRSEPFIDYALDVAYIGDDGGLLHKITPVFNGTPAEVIGGGWPVTLPGAGQVQSPVYDSVSGNVFVTSNAGGTLFVVNSSSGATSTVSTNALFPSEPIVDSASQTVFVFAVTSGFRLSVLQFNTSGTLLSQVSAGSIGGSANAYTGTFDNNYFTNPSSGSLYFAGTISFVATLYRVGFTGTTMNTTFLGPLALSTSASTSSPTPLTEVFNPSLSTAQDRLFVGIDANCTSLNAKGCIESVDISSGLPSAILSSHSLPTAGTSSSVSGIIVDNVSPLSQASSIYFESFTASPPESAIKLTQADLQ